MANLSRQAEEQIQDGLVVEAAPINSELDSLVNGHNSQETRIATLESGDTTISGTKTFSGTTSFSNATGIKTNVIAEYTTGSGVTIDGVLLKDGAFSTDTVNESTPAAGVTVDGVLNKDGMVVVAGTPTTGGQIGYASNVLQYHNGTEVVELGRDVELIATASASSDATIDFDDFFVADYDLYLFEWYDVVPASSGQKLYGRVSISNTYLAADYWGAANYFNETGTGPIGGSSGMAQLILSHNADNSTGESLSGQLILRNPLGTSLYKHIKGYSTYDRSTRLEEATFYGEYRGATSALDGFRFLMSSGNITSGEFRLYKAKTA